MALMNVRYPIISSAGTIPVALLRESSMTRISSIGWCYPFLVLGIWSWLDDKLGADALRGGEGVEEGALTVGAGYGWLLGGLVALFGGGAEVEQGFGDGYQGWLISGYVRFMRR